MSEFMTAPRVTKKCPFCAEEILQDAIVCRFCNRGLTPAMANTAPTATTTWSPGTAAVLSVFLPGLGHVYKGQIFIGLLLFVGTVIGYMMLIFPGLVMHLISVVTAYGGNAAPQGTTQFLLKCSVCGHLNPQGPANCAQCRGVLRGRGSVMVPAP